MTKQTIEQAVHLATSGKSPALRRAANYLDGCPVGGWPETQQALRNLRDDLPMRDSRAYTVDQFVAAAYEVDHADRYRSRI